MNHFEYAKRIIAALNRKDKKALEHELSSLTGLELMLFYNSGYKFLISDVVNLLEQVDVGTRHDHPCPSKPTVLCPLADSKRDESIRTVSLSPGSGPVGHE